MMGDGGRQIDPKAYCYTNNFGACHAGDAMNGNALSVKSEVRNLDESAVMFYTQCTPAPNNCATNSDGQPGHNYTRAGLVLNHGRVYLRDNWDPNIKGVGGSATASGWRRGEVDLTVNAEDNSGICSLIAIAGGQRQDAVRGRDGFSVKPCTDANGHRFTWDTTDWSDGPHEVAVWAYDAAGRNGQSGTWGWHRFDVDNTAPSAPSDLSIDGGEGWTTASSRTNRWTNPGQGNGSPIVGAVVHVCKTGTSNCRTTSAGAGGVADAVTPFDGPGDYTVRVSLRDEAGNHDGERQSNGVRMRFDNVRAGRGPGRRDERLAERRGARGVPAERTLG